jgi:hypothetical protein
MAEITVLGKRIPRSTVMSSYFTMDFSEMTFSLGRSVLENIRVATMQ